LSDVDVFSEAAKWAPRSRICASTSSLRNSRATVAGVQLHSLGRVGTAPELALNRAREQGVDDRAEVIDRLRGEVDASLGKQLVDAACWHVDQRKGPEGGSKVFVRELPHRVGAVVPAELLLMPVEQLAEGEMDRPVHRLDARALATACPKIEPVFCRARPSRSSFLPPVLPEAFLRPGCAEDDILRACPICVARAIVELTARLKKLQPDDTTLVCHPGFGGCNQGFAV